MTVQLNGNSPKWTHLSSATKAVTKPFAYRLSLRSRELRADLQNNETSIFLGRRLGLHRIFTETCGAPAPCPQAGASPEIAGERNSHRTARSLLRRGPPSDKE